METYSIVILRWDDAPDCVYSGEGDECSILLVHTMDVQQRSAAASNGTHSCSWLPIREERSECLSHACISPRVAGGWVWPPADRKLIRITRRKRNGRFADDRDEMIQQVRQERGGRGFPAQVDGIRKEAWINVCVVSSVSHNLYLRSFEDIHQVTCSSIYLWMNTAAQYRSKLRRRPPTTTVHLIL